MERQAMSVLFPMYALHVLYAGTLGFLGPFLAATLIYLIYITVRNSSAGRSSQLPPGPKGLPIIGNLVRPYPAQPHHISSPSPA